MNIKLKQIISKLSNILALSENDFKSRYAGNFLGVLWAFIYPCVTVVLYWFVFQVALKSNVGTNGNENVPYILWLVSALVPYFFLCDALPGAASVMIDYSYLVKKVKFDTGALPLVRVISNLRVNIFFVFLLMCISLYFGYSFKPQDLWVIYYMAAEFVFVLAAGTLLSVLTVFIRDICSIIGVAVQIGYWLTPLFWDISGIDSRLGGIIMAANPITYITEGFRNTILYGASPLDMPCYTLYFWCVTLALCGAGYVLFRKVRNSLADYV